MDADGLSQFLTEPGREDLWRLPAGHRPLAAARVQVDEPLLGERTTRGVSEGGIRLNRVTHLPLRPDDVPAVAGYRADWDTVQLVLAMFWFMLTEPSAHRRYHRLRIRIRLRPPAPVLLLSPDRPDTPGQRALAPEIAASVAGLLPPQPGATAVDYGEDGFGWSYQATDDAPLIFGRLNTLVVLELATGTASLDGELDAEAQVSRQVLGDFRPRRPGFVNPAVTFQVPLAGPPAAPGRLGRQDFGGQASGRQDPGRADQRPPEPRRRRQPDRRYDVGLIIPLREEFDCARRVFTFGPQQHEQGSYLYPFTVPGSDLRGVAMVLHDMGAAVSGVTAASLLTRFDLPLLALMGIAGGLDSDLRLGDVVVAKGVDPYFHRAKARPDASGDGFEFDSGGSAWRAGADLVRFADNFRYRADEPDEFAGWQARGDDRRTAAGLPKDGPYGRERPDYVVAPLASGEIVSAAAGFSRWLRTHHRECAAVEMEAGGVAQAVYEHGGADMFIVRGISDFADERKADLDAAGGLAAAGRGAWREYAALNAADLLATMLRSPGFPWPA